MSKRRAKSVSIRDLMAITANALARKGGAQARFSLLMQGMAGVNGERGFFQSTGEFPSFKDRHFNFLDKAGQVSDCRK